ncbi:TadE/TadG family type IV pilus assembly protein [Pseudonocardia nigra]|uniref:TadE/TadG family type IV pilus assembly protein n=1 Tax=Pseudonocardia nigra TaxID=1921578 RepID=UPI001C5E7697|nr:TadE/TadG family type IV pilus assembly protein [Pseudonocardia nigra]
MTAPDPAGEAGGGPSVEAAVLAVVVGLLITLLMAVGRLSAAESAADHAARTAARTASILRDPTEARARATTEATRVLDQQGLACDELRVAVDIPAASPIGTPAAARAVVTCAVRWFDLGLPGLPGTHELSAEFSSPVDSYRERP